MARTPTPTWYFALVVVRLGHRFLLTQEKKYGSTWSIPGGRVEPGESLTDGAIREVLEETGVPVTLEGIYRIEHTPTQSSARIRVIFAGVPCDDSRPKEAADDESLRAAWLTIDEIAQLGLRGSDLRPFLESIARGRAFLPLDALGRELSI
ncbi:MAG: NUDIX hydrolase [Kofleriaceae bacterium]|jgi:ADP-ribose pyrophosphatase YjhB (NUDIX family)|nr:NUDIX hydrolase [Kofleriaceae bacterium]MBP6840426.1 NUDIX hydrolase [Kofleriaceae bacterium]MBP9203324.1 NUDIX hydrolase [Kofleriaceae bacterium]